MSDIDDAFSPDFLEEAQRKQAASSIVNLVDAEPDKAARAIQLGDATGVHPSLIRPNMENFEEQHRVAVNSKLVNDNHFLQQYLNSHSLAAEVSANDIGNLDAASEALEEVKNESGLSKWLDSDSIAQTFMKGFGEAPISPQGIEHFYGRFSRPDEIEFALSHPVRSALLQPLTSAIGLGEVGVESFMRITSGLMELGEEGIAKVFGTGVAKTVRQIADWKMMSGDVFAHPTVGKVKLAEGGHPIDLINNNADLLRKMKDALGVADKYREMGEEPGPGVHPFIDKLKSEQAKVDADALDDAISASAKSETRELSPDLYRGFGEIHFGDRQIGIDSEAVRKLYGDKLPTIDDNLLGWVPDLSAKLEAAEGIGGDISMPLADYVARVDKEVHKELHDFIRVRDGGLTLEEAKGLIDKEAIAEPHTLVRAEAGLEPMFQIGDRKLTLERKTGAEKPGWDVAETSIAADQFTIKDDTGKPIGELHATPFDNGTKLNVDWIGGFEKQGYGPNSLGPALTRSLIQQLKTEFPNLKEIGGFRISGARTAGEYRPAKATIKVQDMLDPLTHEHFRNLLSQNWEELHAGVSALFSKDGVGEASSSPMGQLVLREIARLAPEAQRAVAHDVTTPVGPVRGAYFPNLRAILVSLRNRDPIGTAHHEIVHFLKDSGLFRPEEWSELERMATTDWMDRFNVAERWAKFDTKLPEEAIADAFAAWEKGAKFDKVHAGLFQRIKDFFEGLRQSLGRILGHEHLTWEQIFEKIDSGEIGAREAGGEAGGGPKFQTEDKGKKPPPQKPGTYRFYHGTAYEDASGFSGKTFVTTSHQYARDYHGGPNNVLYADLTKEEAEKRGLWDDANDMPLSTGSIDDGKDVLKPFEIQGEGLSMTQARLEGGHEPFKAPPDDIGLFDRAKAMGITQAHMDRMLKLIRKRNEEDLEAAQARAARQQKRSQTKEYKERRTTVRDEVREQLSTRPDLAVDAMMAKGDIKLHPDTLTEEQKQALPKDYIQKKNGVHPDDLAPHFGYTSGDALVERLGMLAHDRKLSNMSARDYFNRLVDVETDRRMNAEFGDLAANIAEAAKEQAISQTQVDLVAEETIAYALAAGKEPQLTKEDVVDMVKQKFDATPVGQIDSKKLIQNGGKLGRKIEEYSSAGNWAAAYRVSQQRHFNTVATKMALEYERGQKALERTAKTLRKREVPSIEQEFTNWARDLLLRTGLLPDRIAGDLAELKGLHTAQTLADFITAKEAEYLGMRTFPIEDWVKDPSFRKPLKELTVGEFRDYKNAIDSIIKAGRDEKKIYKEGEAQDRKQLIGELLNQVTSFPAKTVEPGYEPGKARKFISGISALATVMRRFDRGDRYGRFQSFITNRMASSDNYYSQLEKEATREWTAIAKDIGDLTKKIDIPPSLKKYGDIYNGFTRENLLSLISNAGNASNWKVTAEGWGAKPEELFRDLVAASTKEDWDRAQLFADKIFNKLAKLEDQSYDRTNGVTIEKIKLNSFTITFPDGRTGTYKGWYHPLIHDSLWHGKQIVKGGEPFMDYGHVAPPHGWTIKRTGAIYPVDLSFSQLPYRIAQQIHNISHREAVLEINKIFRDPELHNAITKHYGPEYANMLMPWLKDNAGLKGTPSGVWGMVTNLSNTLRANAVSTYIGFNPSTPAKHFPTAFFMSAKELGWKNMPAFLDAYRQLHFSSAKDYYKDLVNKDEEIQRRERHWEETFGGVQLKLYKQLPLKEMVTKAGAYVVAKSDRFSADALWLARYNLEMADHGKVGLAREQAQLSVRRAHGSTAPSNKPELVRRSNEGINGWLTTVYGFMGERMQRLIETAHSGNDAWGFVRKGEIDKAAGEIFFNAIPNYLIYVAVVGAVEEGVNAYFTDSGEGPLTHLAKIGFGNISSSFLYLRDFIHAAETGRPLEAGMLGSVGQDMSKVVNDFKRTWHDKKVDKQHAGKVVKDVLTLAGVSKGWMPKTVAEGLGFGVDYINGVQKPKGVNDWFRGATRGDIHRRVVK